MTDCYDLTKEVIAHSKQEFIPHQKQEGFTEFIAQGGGHGADLELCHKPTSQREKENADVASTGPGTHVSLTWVCEGPSLVFAFMSSIGHMACPWCPP